MERFILYGIFVLLVFFLIRKKKKQRMNTETIDYSDLIDSESKMVLYLRSFADDGIVVKPPINLHPTITNAVAISHEQELARQIKDKAIFFTVGRPDEELPELGARRLYIKSENWQNKVDMLLKKSDLIVFRPAISDGLNWELNKIIEDGHLPKTVIFSRIGEENFKPLYKARYNSFKNYLSVEYHLFLPKFDYKKKFIYFDNQSG